MPEKVKFKFFEGQDVEQFTFYRIPKQLFTLEYFKGMSSDAKVLYGLMLDRVSLSLKNNWFDDDNRAYIYFSIDDVMELLGCGKNKAIKCLKELDDETGIGLTQKRRQGFGKSNMIYVKTFMVEKTEAESEESKKVGKVDKVGDESNSVNLERKSVEKQTSVQGTPAAETAEKQTSVSGPDQQIDGEQTSVQEASKVVFMDRLGQKPDYSGKNNEIAERTGQISHSGREKDTDTEELDCQSQMDLPSQKFENQTTGAESADTEVYNLNFKKFKKQTSRSPKNKLQEVYFSNPNNTYKSNTEYSYNKSHLILSPEDCRDQEGDPVDEMRYDGDRDPCLLTHVPDMLPQEPEDRIAMMQAYQTLIRRNIDYDNLMTFPDVDHELAQEIYELIVETVLCLGKEIVISSNRYPIEVVRSRFLKLNYMHIRYVMECLEKNTTKVKNIRKYLLASLFNAPATMDGYYRAEVQHDMPRIALGGEA